MKKLLLSFAIWAAVIPSQSFAGIGNSFSYVGIGSQFNNFKDIDFTPDVGTDGYAPAILAEDTSGFGGRMFFGKQFNQYWSVETGIDFMSSAEFKLLNNVTDANGNITQTSQYSGKFSTFALDVKAFATLPITNSQFVRAHIGALFWDNDFEYVSGAPGSTELSKSSDTKVSALFGIGYGYAINKSNAFVLEFETSTIAEVRVDTISLSFLVKI